MFEFFRKTTRDCGLCKIIQISILLPLLTVFGLGQYRFDQWTADTGLPQNSVYDIRQTRDGYLWVATADGLARFDGVRFTVFNRSNSPGIDNNRFINMFEARNGDLWAGTEERGFVRYRRGQFTRFEIENEPTYQGNRIVQFFDSDTDEEVLLVSDSLVYRFAEGKSSLFDTKNAAAVPADSPVRTEPKAVFCFLSEEPQQIGCLVDGKLAKFTGEDELSGVGIIKSVRDVDGSFWILMSNGDVLHVEAGKITKAFFKGDGFIDTPLHMITGAGLSILSKDAQGGLWLTDIRTKRKELLTRQPPPTFADVHSAHQDFEGNIWLGSLRSGLFRVRKQVINGYSKANGLSDNNVYPILEDRRGTIWIGTTKGIFNYRNGTFAPAPGSENFYVDALGEDGSGRILASSFGGLYVLEGDEFKAVYQCPFGGIWAIHKDADDALWLGSQNALIRIRDQITTTFTASEGLAGNSVKVIIDDKNGGLWIGAYGGLSRYQDGKITSWPETSDLTIRSLYLDADGVLWIGSYDSGLARFKDGKFTFYTSRNGLFNDGAFQILEDDQNTFWISSNRGIYRVKKDELNEFAEGKRETITSVAYGKSDGMLNVECNGGRSPGGVRARDGSLWFPTQDGVALVNPSQVKSNPQPPPVVIEEVKIDNKSLPEHGFDQERSPIRIESNQQNFEIIYTALSFINSENLRFKYKLEGLETDWIDAGTRRLAYYSHVAPGTYTFRVIAANSDGVWNEEGASLRITVLPPFYRTWWFWLTVGALGLMTVYTIYRRRVFQFERARRLQEEFSRRLISVNEAERRRIAGELHDSIGQSLAMIKNRAVLSAESVADEKVRKQLDLITEQTTQTIGEVREISYALRPYLLENLGLTKAVESLLDRIAETSGLTIQTKLDDVDDIFDGEAEMSIYRIIQESLSNILKHAEASTVQVFLKKSDRNLTVLISDDGTGFDLKQIEGRETGKGGFGLLGIAERVKMLGGTQEIESEIGGGTTLMIQIPVPSAG